MLVIFLTLFACATGGSRHRRPARDLRRVRAPAPRASNAPRQPGEWLHIGLQVWNRPGSCNRRTGVTAQDLQVANKRTTHEYIRQAVAHEYSLSSDEEGRFDFPISSLKDLCYGFFLGDGGA